MLRKTRAEKLAERRYQYRLHNKLLRQKEAKARIDAMKLLRRKMEEIKDFGIF